MLVNKLEAGWLICFMVGMAAPQFVEMSNPLVGRASHLIARYSYGIYLTHYFCIWLAFAKLSFLPLVSRWIVFIAAAAIIPILLYHLLELPLMNLGKRLAETRLVAADRPKAGSTLEAGSLQPTTTSAAGAHLNSVSTS